MRVVLASASPRRLELLRQVGVEPEVVPADIDESALAGESPEQSAFRLGREKARGIARVTRAGLVIGADTVVEVDGRLLGKPADAEDARRMMRLLSGRTHRVHTGVTLVRCPSASEASGLATTEIDFAPLSEAEVAWYAATGDGDGKAGGYAAQGRAALFITGIRGSYSNVVGLPIELVARLARSLGVTWMLDG